MSGAVKFVAFDLGAESGRAVLGLFDGATLKLEEVHRFPNGPVRVVNSIHWDVLRLWTEVKDALRICARRFGKGLSSIGLDTWGVDFALLGRNDVLLGNPYHYRDRRTDGMLEEAFRRVPREEIFEATGIQFMQLNSLYQLLAMVVEKSPLLNVAQTLLMMPDLFNFWLTGRKVCEFTEATTSQFYDPRAGTWAKPMMEKMGLPTQILTDIVAPATVLDRLRASVAEEVGLHDAHDVVVVAPACHDTASAVAAVPAKGTDFAYISSGTWSLMGVEVKEPIITGKSLSYNFTNEGGVCDTFRFLKNIMGLWLVQECRRIWARAAQTHTYDELTQMASEAKPFLCLVEPDHATFLHPDDMSEEIRKFCRQSGQPIPEDKGAVIRCALESLALKYRWVLERLEEMLGKRLEVIHIIGGGSQNKLLNQFTADSTARTVLAGPVEATAIGNIMMQALALGYVKSLDEARQVIRRSFDVTTYEPQNTAAWDEAYGRFLKVMEEAQGFL